jgi:hypothetical protein
MQIQLVYWIICLLVVLICILLYFPNFINYNLAMSLAERINPNEQALVVAGGRDLYAFTHGRLKRFATLPGRVETLQTHNGHLLAGGSFRGAVEVLSGKPTTGRFYEWSNLETYDGNLVGTVRNANKKFTGIWQVDDMEIVAKRNGRTTLLAGGDRLLDVGNYGDKQTQIHDANKDVVVYSGKSPLLSILVKDNESFYYTYGSMIYQRTTDGISSNVHYYAKDLYNLVNKMNKSRNAWFMGRTLHEEKIWAAYMKTFERFKKDVPRSMRYLDEDRWGNEFDHVEILNIPFKDACIDYHGKFPGYESFFVDPRMDIMLGYHLIPILYQIEDIVQEYRRKDNVRVMTLVNGNLVVGGYKRLEVAEEKYSPYDNQKILGYAPQPITALTSMSAEVYDDGIKQEISRRQRAKFCHAKGSKPVIVFERKVA